MTTPDVPEALRAAIAGRYEVMRLLGRGGMATVYLARDLKHGRDVALKVLLPDLAALIGADRFLREIGIAARLTHPRILALHDSGEAAGFLYYVMPYAAGGSLRTRLQAERRVPLDAALAITDAIADALTYAHRTGVLHRDIKPENILFAEGHPLVTDFGIAKAVSTAGGDQLTRTGFPIGTPGYMSPEQAAGIAQVDARTDVYSLAAVAYEMITGEIPRGWPTEDEVRTGRLAAAPAAHRHTFDLLPSYVEGALVRGLAVRPDQRTATPTALMQELSQPGARRRYGDAEVRDLVRRASELEVTAPTVDSSMTIGGVERLAAEAGIDPARVREAAALVEAAQEPEPHPWWSRVIGGPTRLVVERVVTGEVPDAEFPVLVDEIRRTLGDVGLVSALGRTMTWTTARAAGGRNLQISVSVRAGRTRVLVLDRLGDLQGGLFGGVMGGLGGGGMGPIIAVAVEALKVPHVLFAAIPLWLLTVFAGTRSLYYHIVSGRKRKLDALADRLATLARDLAPASLPRDPGPVRGRLP
jgi:hypothetical protein